MVRWFLVFNYFYFLQLFSGVYIFYSPIYFMEIKLFHLIPKLLYLYFLQVWKIAFVFLYILFSVMTYSL